jgi:hypothetical protein
LLCSACLFQAATAFEIRLPLFTDPTSGQALRCTSVQGDPSAVLLTPAPGD